MTQSAVKSHNGPADGLQRQLSDHVNPILDTYVNAVLIQRVLEA